MNFISLLTAFGSGSVVTVFVKTLLQKRLNSKTEWHKAWAADFLECSNEFNRLASKVIVGISSTYGQDRRFDDREQVKTQKIEEIKNYSDQIIFYEWELKKYSQFASKKGRGFDESASELFNSLKELINYSKNPKGTTFDLEKIREMQFKYSIKSRELHAEILGL